MTKFDLKRHVTNSIIKAIEEGTAPWRKPWTGSASNNSFPLRSTGEPYRGINILLLWGAAQEHKFVSAHWFTYKQALAFGGQVRKGQKSTTVIKYGTFERENDAGIEKKIQYTRAYRVFNADQIDGLPNEYYATPKDAKDLGTTADPKLDAFFASIGVPIDTSNHPRAYYQIGTDRIHMPPINTFYGAAEYYGVLAHEQAHASGHKSRLDRFEKFRDRQAYAFEELVAEIAACILGAEMGFRPDFDQSAAYIEGWLKALNDDTSMIFRAASEAQKAVDFMKSAADQESAEAA